MSPPIAILAGGGHATVLLDVIQQLNLPLLGIVSPESPQHPLDHITWLGADGTFVSHHTPAQVQLVNGIGSIGDTRLRREIYARYRAQGYRFASLIHPTACISPLATQKGDGLQALAGSIISAYARVGDNVLVNTRAVIEHGCSVASHCHVATGAIICGDCTIGEAVHIGAGATINQGLKVGNGSIIASGAVVTKDVPAHCLVAGVPATLKRILK